VSGNGNRFSVELPATLVDALAERLLPLVVERLAAVSAPTASGPYLTVPEAAEYLRCRRQRIDDLLSQRRLSRVKEGGRTLVLRAEVEALAEVERVARSLPTGASDRMGSGLAR
jgi:excisionase family DNA binding protein